MRRGTSFALGLGLGCLVVGGWFLLPRVIAQVPAGGAHLAARKSGGSPVVSHKIAFASDVQRPNFLIVIGDDYGQDQVGAYKVHPRPPPSPRIDALAAQGVLFRNAFVSSPSCTPCRSALLSGRHFFRCGRGSTRSGGWPRSAAAHRPRPPLPPPRS